MLDAIILNIILPKQFQVVYHRNTTKTQHSLSDWQLVVGNPVFLFQDLFQ